MKVLGKSIELPIERISKLSKNQRLAVVAGSVILVLAVFMSVLFWPQTKKIEQLSAQVAATSQELDSVKQAAGGLEALKARMATTEADFKRALLLLPNCKEIPGLLSSISQAGSQSGLEFILFRPKAEVAKQFYADIPVEIKVFGNYHDIARFFDAVSKLPRIVSISDIKMKEPKDSGGRIKVTAECLATTYKFIENPKDAAKQPDKPKPKP
jgi:type IV pilus assembly protein PilO